MIGISEGIVLADRYRLTRRQSERETGASWIAVDLETGSDVWVQFADHGGLARAADIIRGLADSSSHAAALPSVLDTGELRMIVDSRALAALRGGAEAHATHVEIVIEFAVVRPLTGRGLPAKIQRRALPPAEALAVAASLAGALGEALAAGGSHGWLGSGSIWLVRRGGCVLDLALGLAYPDGSAIELEQQVTGYYAPERLAVAAEANAAVGSGSKATQAADVFALGWMVYEMLIGHAELLAEYERLVAGAGAVTTVELLALWRARARAHLIELVEADSALAVLILACLAENPAERPDFAAFGERARAAAKGLAGVAPLVVPVSRTRTGAAAAEVGEASAAALVAGVIGGAAVLGAAAVGAELLAGEAVAAEAAAESLAGAESVGAAGSLGAGGALGAGGGGAGAATQSVGMAELADTGAGSATSSAAAAESAGSAASAESAVVAEAETVVLAAAAAAGIGVGAAAAESLAGSGSGSASGAGSGSASGAASSSAELASEGFAGSGSVSGGATEVSVTAEKEIERLSHRARLATIGGTAAAVVALGVGIAVGYSIGHSGGSNNSALLTAAGTNAAGTLASASSSPVAAPAPTVTVTVTVTASESAPATSASAAASGSASSPAASGSGASASAGAVTSPGLPAASSSTEAINELTEEIQYTLSVGQISQSTAERLTAAVAKLRSSLGTGSSANSLSSLTSLIRSLEQSGHLPGNAELTLESILGYFYAEAGSGS